MTETGNVLLSRELHVVMTYPVTTMTTAIKCLEETVTPTYITVTTACTE